MFNLSGKTALVTGASGGIGGAIAKALAGQGARVALSGTRLEALEKLEKASKNGKLTADELADLGALYVRLGETGKAIACLRVAQRSYPNHFAINANLGTAWQLHGDLEQAALCLQQAVKLAPGKLQKAEEYHLKLIRLRLKNKKADTLDDLFGVRYVDDKGGYVEVNPKGS